MWPLIAVAAVVLFGAIFLYNGLVQMRQLTRNAWADVDVYLKRRAELIPNVVTSVKAYASHEQALLEGLAEARSRAVALPGATLDRASAEATVGTKLVNVLALAENYPDLKSNENFLELQGQLKETEKLIANARQYYNACVRDYNTKIEAFPSNILASVGGFKHAEFFELESVQEREVPTVG